jgi:hypothetical protein
LFDIKMNKHLSFDQCYLIFKGIFRNSNYWQVMKRWNFTRDPPTTLNEKRAVTMTFVMLSGSVMPYNSLVFKSVMHENNRWLTITYMRFKLLRFWMPTKNITLQNVCRSIMHRVSVALVMKNRSVPLFNPIVPGPTVSARILTIWKS